MKTLASFALAIVAAVCFTNCTPSSPLSPDTTPQSQYQVDKSGISDTLSVSVTRYAKGGVLFTLEGIMEMTSNPSSSGSTWPTELVNAVRNAMKQSGNGMLYGELTFNVPNTEGTARFEFHGNEKARLGSDGFWHRQDQKVVLEIHPGGKYTIIDPTIEDEESILPDYEG